MTNGAYLPSTNFFGCTYTNTAMACTYRSPYRIYGLFTMQSVMACGFGREVNVLQGESDHLAETAAAAFSHQEDNQGMSFDTLDFMMILSK